MPYTIEVYTNSFEVTSLPDKVFHQYDVSITPLVVRDKAPPLSKRRNHEIIDRMQLNHAEIFTSRAHYDGAKLLYSLRDVSASLVLDVCMARRRPDPTHRVRVQRVGVIDPQRVRELITRPQNNHTSSGDPSAALTAVQLLIRQTANMRHGSPPHARTFLVDSRRFSKTLRMGLSMWPCYFQSVRPALNRLLINVDRTMALVYTKGNLFDTMMIHLELRNASDLYDLKSDQYARLQVFLKGVLVKVTCAPNVRAKPISRLVRQAGLQEFDKDGRRWTVADHFQSKYNVRVRSPKAVGVRLGQSAVVPAELCEIVPGQPFRRRIPQQLQSDFLRFATQKPEQRLRDIQDAVADGIFDWANSDYMQAAGMKVNPNILSITGKVMDQPAIAFGDHREVPHDRGAWNMKHKRFFSVKGPLFAWAVVNFDNRASEDSARDFINKFIENLKALGMPVPCRPLYYNGNPADPLKTLEQAGEAVFNAFHQSHGIKRPQVLLVLLPSNHPECRRQVKHWGDVTRKVTTQCLRGGKWNADVDEGKKDQYRNNVALKINARLGGVNFLPVSAAPVGEILAESMVVGLDVSHPGPGVQRPSVAALVASVDSNITTFTSFSKVQQPRLEIIDQLDSMMKSAFIDYLGYRRETLGDQSNRPPRYILCYRDGVSEGEFARVSKEEIDKIKSAMVRMGWTNPSTRPQLLFIVVGKRHHVRFFPKHPQDRDRTGNCPAGFLVSDQITNPHYEEFYLQAHPGLKGTSRPGHYTVLANEPRFPSDLLHKLSYHLCHLYAPATRSVSIPTPVYYAHKLAGRLDFQCRDITSLSDAASVSTGDGGEPFDLAQWTSAFKDSGLNKTLGFT